MLISVLVHRSGASPGSQLHSQIDVLSSQLLGSSRPSARRCSLSSIRKDPIGYEHTLVGSAARYPRPRPSTRPCSRGWR